jgi:hypothetical protein
MAKLGVLPELTKKYILERVKQEEIMEYYTGIPVQDATLVGNSFKSPMRDDNEPTCNYYYKADSRGEIRLRLKDWNGSFNGDVFDVASHFTKIRSNNSQGFKLLLHQVAKDFKIHRYVDGSERDKLDIVINEYHKRADLKSFKVVPRHWNKYDEQYWYNRFGITSELLKIGKVIPVQELHVEGKDGYLQSVYKYYSKDPAFAYYGGNINGINLWRVYFPFRRKGGIRFMSNYAFIQGLHIFQPARIGIITKSYKDVLVYKMFGIEAVAVPSETYVMTKDEYFNIKMKCDIVVTNFDYDRTGIRLAQKYKKIHGCLPLMFTKGRFKQPDFGVKDFSEFREQYGVEKTKDLINTIIEQYYTELEQIKQYNYESLKWIQ